jgi:hypothetical protein
MRVLTYRLRAGEGVEGYLNKKRRRNAIQKWSGRSSEQQEKKEKGPVQGVGQGLNTVNSGHSKRLSVGASVKNIDFLACLLLYPLTDT